MLLVACDSSVWFSTSNTWRFEVNEATTGTGCMSSTVGNLSQKLPEQAKDPGKLKIIVTL
jgi:hypothetical protein